LEKGTPEMQEALATKLAQIGDSNAVQILMPSLNSSNVDLQYKAIAGISKLALSVGVELHQPSFEIFKENPVKFVKEYQEFVKANGAQVGLAL